MVDITDRKRTEETLRESEAHCRYTVELNPQMLWTAGRDGMVLDVSGRWKTLTGYAATEAIGDGWAKAIHPDDLPMVAAAWGRSLQTGEPLDIEFRVYAKGGTYRWMRSRAAPRRDPQGEIIRWYGSAEDLQKQKAAEEALRGLSGRPEGWERGNA
jgi:PAS domain S-box-containing protein